MNEQELLAALVEAERDVANAKKSLAEAHKTLTRAETDMINAKLHKERLAESLRIFRNQQVIPGTEYALYDEEDGSR